MCERESELDILPCRAEMPSTDDEYDRVQLCTACFWEEDRPRFGPRSILVLEGVRNNNESHKSTREVCIVKNVIDRVIIVAYPCLPACLPACLPGYLPCINVVVAGHEVTRFPVARSLGLNLARATRRDPARSSVRLLCRACRTVETVVCSRECFFGRAKFEV